MDMDERISTHVFILTVVFFLFFSVCLFSANVWLNVHEPSNMLSFHVLILRKLELASQDT